MSNRLGAGKALTITVRTTEEALELRGLTLVDVRARLEELTDIFGIRYHDLFPVNVEDFAIDGIVRAAEVLTKIQHCEGFRRHIGEYSAREYGAHFYTATVASYFLDLGYEVELEPDMGSEDGAHPDIKVSRNGTITFLECKTSDITNYLESAKKARVAGLIFERVRTCDQLTFHFTNDIVEAEIDNLLSDPANLEKIHQTYRHGADGSEHSVRLTDELVVGVIQRQAIADAHDGSVEVKLTMYMTDVDTNNRQPGVVLMRGGRSVGVFSNVDYNQKLQDKYEQSHKQMVPDQRNLVFLDDLTVVGDPSEHETWIDRHWLNADLPACSGVVIYAVYQDAVGSRQRHMTYYPNAHARNPIALYDLQP